MGKRLISIPPIQKKINATLWRNSVPGIPLAGNSNVEESLSMSWRHHVTNASNQSFVWEGKNSFPQKIQKNCTEIKDLTILSSLRQLTVPSMTKFYQIDHLLFSVCEHILWDMILAYQGVLSILRCCFTSIGIPMMIKIYKMVSCVSYLYHGNPKHGKMVFILKQTPCFIKYPNA